MYPAQIKGQLTYEWICPEGLEVFCEGQYGENLYVPWKSVQKVESEIQFGTLYEFGADITWNSPDGTSETRSAFVEVQWYNLQKPSFDIRTDPAQVLITN